MSDRPAHAVLVRSPEKFSAVAVAGVLARKAGAPALDLVPAARRAWGVAAESLPAVEAETLAAELTAADQPSLAAPAALIETPPAPVVVLKAELASDGFDVVAGRENAARERLSWTKVAAVCAAAVEVRSTMTTPAGPDPAQAAERAVRLGLSLMTGLPLTKKKTEAPRKIETRDRALAVDLVFLEPARRLRIESGAFDYSCLGPKMGYSAELNFAALVAELAARAPAALRGKGTRAILARRAGEALYESLEDLGREERWLTTLAALKAAL